MSILLKTSRFFLLGALLVFSNSSFALDPNQILDSSKWFLLSWSDQKYVYYDPYQTLRSPDGTVDTIIYTQSRQTGSLSVPEKLKINCDQKIYQTYSLDDQLAWKMTNDWIKPTENTLGSIWVKNLCGYVNDDGDQIFYIGTSFTKDQTNTPQYYYWNTSKTIKPLQPNGKTYIAYVLDGATNKSFYYYVFLDCQKGKAASSSTLTPKQLDWIPTPPATSPLGYMLSTSCGFDLPLTSSNSKEYVPEEETVCEAVGYKKKTEKFAQCALFVLEERERSLSPDDATCKKYGFKPKTNEYASCRQQIELARAEAQQQQALYAAQEKLLDEQKRQRDRDQALKMIQLGLGMATGTNSGTNQPLPPPSTKTYLLPGGKHMNCTTTGNVTSCF